MNMLILGDFLKEMRLLPSDSIDLIFTDPPYARKYIYIWEDLAKESARLLKPGCSFLSLCGIINLPEILDAVKKYLSYYWCCALLHEEIGFVSSVNMFNAWKPVIWFTKGHPKPRSTISDGISPHPQQKQDHRWQQTETWARHFISTLVPSGGLVLDPFVGTGTTAVVCSELGIDCIGIDNDPRQIETAQRKTG